MDYFKRVLVGVDLSHAGDLSAPTQCAIERGIWLAEQTSAELTFFAACDLAASPQNAEAQSILEELIAEAESQDIPAKAQLARGDAGEEIIRHVRENGNDLVIVGTRDAEADSLPLYGSTGMRLLQVCPCPVWIAQPNTNWDDLEILVACDFSEVAQDALELGVRTARMTGARLRIVHALEEQSPRQAAEQKLNEQLAQTDFRTVEAGVIAEVIDGPPDTVILETIAEHPIHWLIMGITSNTTEKLLPQLPCTILAIKPQGFECPVS